jgi:hypothetical protein
MGFPMVRSRTEGDVRPRELARIEQVLGESGAMPRQRLAEQVRARTWGPGRFSGALHDAVASGRVHRVGKVYELAPSSRSGERPPADHGSPRTVDLRDRPSSRSGGGVPPV